jgi:hypothetical protein
VNPKCEACDFRDRGETCWAQSPGRGNFCRLIAKGRAGYRELVRARTLAEPAGATPDPTPPVTETDPGRERAAILARRAGKARVPLGTRAPARPGGG